ncbi:MAG: nickel pincer cofactor biosynthesis protein LarB [Longimicrobiales bacterium]|nr:nickel pincer cofactor biosynthesis protein LarB [Longimicrobiales bacterium]
MRSEEIKALLDGVADGSVRVDEAVARLKDGPLRQDELSFATLDHHRHLRQGLAEVVYGEGKTIEEILEIARRLSAPGVPVLLTRLSPEKLAALENQFPDARLNPRGRTCLVHPPPEKGSDDGLPFVAVVSGGTADLPVAEEAAEVCVAMGVPVHRIYDVGVAGLHRILSKVGKLREAAAVVVVAGMEGALPSVVGGLVGSPVFAVPTSVGYGASFHGLAALLAMLNSCAPGVTVSNIDNGFSAGIAAARVAKAVAAALTKDPGT